MPENKWVRLLDDMNLINAAYKRLKFKSYPGGYAKSIEILP